MKTILRKTFTVFVILLLLAIIFSFGFAVFSLSFERVELNLNNITSNNLEIDVFNAQKLKIHEDNQYNHKNVDIELLSENTKQAFISVEDKNFYKHNGIDIARILKATANNIASLSFKEGASTITQQLIKNTHLSNKKTLSRKINEISLAMKLEKKLSKDEILENYLNVIFFGNNCYGIENASEYYFSKKAKDLSTSESATLAGIIKSPSLYSPIKHPDKCLKRRNLVLNELKKDGIITDAELETSLQTPLNLNLNKNKQNKLNSYSQCAIDEACKILGTTEKQMAISGFKIFTYADINKQKALEKTIQNFEIPCDYSIININSKTGGVEAYLGKSDFKILDSKRQPGSCVKPVLVYGPAINENIISPATLLLDEPLTIDNYSPQNVGGSYSGYISARNALAKSLNIPAVKVASYLGINKLKAYGGKQEIVFDEKDQSYALALGGFTYGTNLKELCGTYTTLANNGKFISPKFVSYITTKDGKIIYKNNSFEKQVFREDTAYLVTDMLKTSAKSGTAKKLSDLDFEVASKTGTVGTKLGNTDAYNIAYTSQDIVGVWCGNMDNKLTSIAGGGLPTNISKEFLKTIYKESKPENFKMPSSVEYLNIDKLEADKNHIIVKANKLLPERFCEKEIFSKFNLPKEENFSFVQINTPTLVGEIQHNKIKLSFDAVEYLSYNLYKTSQNKTTLLKSFSNQIGKVEYFDEINKNQKNSYFIECFFDNKNNEEIISSKSNTLDFYISKNQSKSEKWYI